MRPRVLVPAIALAAASVAIAQGVCTPTISEYRAAVIDRALAVGKAIGEDRKAFQAERKALQGVFGQAPKPTIELFGKQNGLALGIITAEAMRSGISPELLTSAMAQEGLDTILVHSTVDVAIDGYGTLGVDGFATDMKMLQRQGFLRKDFDGIFLYGAGNENSAMVDKNGKYDGTPKTHWINEAGQLYQAFAFKNLAAAAEAMAAFIRYKESLFLRDAKALGIDTAAMDPLTREAWAYLYYNAGEGRGKQLLTKSKQGVIPKYTARPRQHDALRNANRIMAAITQYRDRGLFPDPVTVGDCAKSKQNVGSNVGRNQDTKGGAAASSTPKVANGAGTPGLH